MAERFDLGADHFGESAWRTAGAHEEIAIAHIAPLLETLEVREINDRRSSITQIRNPRIRSDANDLNVLKIRHEAEADAFPDGLAVRKQAVSEVPAQDRNAGMVLILYIVEFAAGK